MRAARMAAMAIALAVLCAGCRQPGFPADAAATPPPVSGTPLIGVYEQGVPMHYGLITSFAAATGIKPRIVLYYSGWHEKFWTSFADTATGNGAIPFVEIDPTDISLAAIAAGRYDKYLRSYAAKVRIFGHPVILGFGHEMNGNWYSWGADHTAPATFIAAWRHIVLVFRSAGASNVTWLWVVSSINLTSAPLRQWWPGPGWVDEVGIDGYYYRKSDTFASVFGTTIASVRSFTTVPILISETAVGPAAGPGKIAGLFAGVRADHLVGLVWFDRAQHDPPLHLDWRLENNPAMLAAFRAAASTSGDG
jgi:mannan endo-1,4-beta-mannosidase